MSISTSIGADGLVPSVTATCRVTLWIPLSKSNSGEAAPAAVSVFLPVNGSMANQPLGLLEGTILKWSGPPALSASVAVTVATTVPAGLFSGVVMGPTGLMTGGLSLTSSSVIWNGTSIDS